MKNTHPDAYDYYIKLFNEFDINISDNYWLIHESTLTQNLSLDIAFLQDIVCKTKKIPLLMYDSNPNWDIEDYFLTIYENFKNVVLSSADMNNLWGAHPNIVYFPIFYLEQLRQPNYQDYKKKYRISFLSNVSRFHRIYFYYTVKNSITNDDCFSIADFSSEEYHFYKNDMEDMLGYYEGDIERTIPFITNNANAYNNSIGKTSFIDFTNKHIAYASYVNVVGESDITAGKVFLTEKTWKAVRSGCIPVFFNPEYNIILKQVGFNFDNEINTIKSNYLDKINHLDNFMSSHSLDDVKKLHTSQRNAIKSNVDYFYSKDLKKLFNDHLRDKLNI